jgi:hypothetical protein
VRRQVVYTAHLVGPLVEVGGEVPDPDRQGLAPVGLVVAAEVPVFKIANFVARAGTLPDYASFIMAAGLEFPYWF